MNQNLFINLYHTTLCYPVFLPIQSKKNNLILLILYFREDEPTIKVPQTIFQR